MYTRTLAERAKEVVGLLEAGHGVSLRGYPDPIYLTTDDNGKRCLATYVRRINLSTGTEEDILVAIELDFACFLDLLGTP